MLLHNIGPCGDYESCDVEYVQINYADRKTTTYQN